MDSQAADAAGQDELVTSMTENRCRLVRPEDYDAIAAVVDEWWGRPVLASLPRLFLDHFHRSSLVIDGPAGMMAFLIGFLSPSLQERAYIHFVGVAPDARGRGLARGLYGEFFTLARADGRRMVSAVTAPGNGGSISFHQSMGFTVTGPVQHYNGPDRQLVVFERLL